MRMRSRCPPPLEILPASRREHMPPTVMTKLSLTPVPPASIVSWPVWVLWQAHQAQVQAHTLSMQAQSLQVPCAALITMCCLRPVRQPASIIHSSGLQQFAVRNATTSADHSTAVGAEGAGGCGPGCNNSTCGAATAASYNSRACEQLCMRLSLAAS